MNEIERLESAPVPRARIPRSVWLDDKRTPSPKE
jgi:hypothetical protein